LNPPSAVPVARSTRCSLRLFLRPLDTDNLPPPLKGPQDWLITGKVSHQHEQKHSADTTQVSPKQPWGLVFANQALNLDIRFINIQLPPTRKPVGIYLDYAPHLSWLSPENQQPQADCDYRLLTQLGLTGVAPALPTPTKGQEFAFKQAAQSPLMQGLLPPFPAYTPVKRLLTHHSQPVRDQALAQLAQLKSTFPYLIWSLADEPGLHRASDATLDLFRRLLKQTLPQAQILAQLNHNHHEQLTTRYDSVLINQGYGLNHDRLRRIRQSGTRVYLYNLPLLRFSSGFYLWRSGAEGFWQWHGRMPTAHPFDPTDGREDDVQMILPTENVCSPPVLHSALLGIRQGINDLRWLEWLMQNANHNIDSAILLQQINHEISLDWSSNAKKESIKNNQLANNLITRIKQLARPVQSPE